MRDVVSNGEECGWILKKESSGTVVKRRFASPSVLEVTRLVLSSLLAGGRFLFPMKSPMVFWFDALCEEFRLVCDWCVFDGEFVWEVYKELCGGLENWFWPIFFLVQAS